jgi:hypothetical protein
MAGSRTAQPRADGWVRGPFHGAPDVYSRDTQSPPRRRRRMDGSRVRFTVSTTYRKGECPLFVGSHWHSPCSDTSVGTPERPGSRSGVPLEHPPCQQAPAIRLQGELKNTPCPAMYTGTRACRRWRASTRETLPLCLAAMQSAGARALQSVAQWVSDCPSSRLQWPGFI